MIPYTLLVPFAAFPIAMIGLATIGVANFGWNIYQQVELSQAKESITQNKKYIRELRLSMIEVKKEMHELVLKVSEQDKQLQAIKAQTIPTFLASTTLATNFLHTKIMLESIQDEWREKRISSQLFRLINTTIPENMPLKLMVPIECRHHVNDKMVTFRISMQQISNKLIIARADPFVLLTRHEGKICERKFSGPYLVLYHTETHDVCPIDADPLLSNPLLVPENFTCNYWAEEPSISWREITCGDSTLRKPEQFIQVKEQRNTRYIYCPTFEVELKNELLQRTFECPDEVFSVPMNFSVKIGQSFYPVFTKTIESRLELLPTYIQTINARLMPNLEHKDLHELPPDFDHTYTNKSEGKISILTYLVIICSIIIVTRVGVNFYFIMKNRRNRQTDEHTDPEQPMQALPDSN